MIPLKSICFFVLLPLPFAASFSFPTRKRKVVASAANPAFRPRSLLQESAESRDHDHIEQPPHLIFPGGGIYFYWQAGAVTYLRENGYDLDATTMTGASAGALTATLAATNVDFYKATELALSLAADAGVWDRSGGLQGIWGPMIHDWLDELLPEDAVDRVNKNARLTLLVTPVPSFGKEKVRLFRNREDLIQGNTASVHLPWFLDSKLTATFRDRPYIDGSFLARAEDYHAPTTNAKSSYNNTLVLDYNQDPLYQSQSLLSFVEAVTQDGIYKMLEDGKRYASVMEERGMLSILKKKNGI